MVCKWVTALALVLASACSASAQRSLAADNSASVAVIIANKDYGSAKFPVDYAENDGNAIKEYLTRFLRFEERNIIFLKNATRYHFDDVFRPNGRLATLVVPGRSNVFVFYSGHGGPDPVSKQSFLLPTDVPLDRPQDGYAIETLYASLDLIKQKVGRERDVIVMLDACFTGETGRGERFLGGMSPGFVPAAPRSGAGVIKLLASSGSHPAHWDDSLKLGLFTSRFLMAAAGLAAEQSDGSTLQWRELRNYLVRTVDSDARRLASREQVPEIGDANLVLPIGEVSAIAPALRAVRDELEWRKAEVVGTRLAYETYVAECTPNGCGYESRARVKLTEDQRGALGADDRALWARLSASRRYQEYIDNCRAPCAYRKLAEDYLLAMAPPPRPQPPRIEPPLPRPEPPRAEPPRPEPPRPEPRPPVLATAPSPSFDCSRHHSPDETAICRNGHLSYLDRQLDAAYSALRDRLTESWQRNRLRDEQRVWLRQRIACQSNEVCLIAAYQSRLTQLQNWR